MLTDLKERYNDTGKGKLSKMKGDQSGTKVCHFCQKSNRHFTEGQKYDMHLYRECAMLTNCRGCAQVIEISKLSNHLVNECSSQNRAYEMCNDCNMYYLKTEIEQHRKKGNHIKEASSPEGPHNHCPLCHEDIGPTEFAWKRHLIYIGCSQNERTTLSSNGRAASP